MDKMREEFERNWIARGGDCSDLARYPDGHYEPGSGSVGGTYMLDDLQGHWETWQASRKALVVELPPVCDCHSDDKDKGYDICHYVVQAKLEEQGLNFKVEGAERWVGITVKGEGDEQTNVLSTE